MSKINDIDKKKWRDYTDIITDSLWIINRRDNSGAHALHYKGSYIPQIAFQLLTRYTKKGDWVLDPFAGGGTTLIEAQRLSRNSIGIEIVPDAVGKANELIKSERNLDVIAKVYQGDSGNIELEKFLNKYGLNNVQFIMYHPPYWDIIKFSDTETDLSNASSLNAFTEKFDEILKNTIPFLEEERYCALIIGDKYDNGHVTPLSSILMNIFLNNDLILKATIVKNIGDTAGKDNQYSLWRYRALASDFYVFKHEYIFVFKKPKSK